MAKNQLDSRKSYKLMKWAEEHREEFRGSTYKELVTMATAAMGYPVTLGNMRSVVATLEIDMAVLKPKKDDGKGDLFVNTLADRIAVLEGNYANLRRLEDRIKGIVSNVENNVDSIVKRINENEILVELLTARVIGRTN